MCKQLLHTPRTRIGTYPNSFHAVSVRESTPTFEEFSIFLPHPYHFSESYMTVLNPPLVDKPDLTRQHAILDWTKKFVVNRLLYMVLLGVLCLGIFPFCILFPFTMWIGRAWDSASSSKTHANAVEALWDVIGKPYDILVKMVG